MVTHAKDHHGSVSTVPTLLLMFPIRHTISPGQSLRVSHGQSLPNIKIHILPNFPFRNLKGSTCEKRCRVKLRLRHCSLIVYFFPLQMSASSQDDDPSVLTKFHTVAFCAVLVLLRRNSIGDSTSIIRIHNLEKFCNLA